MLIKILPFYPEAKTSLRDSLNNLLKMLIPILPRERNIIFLFTSLRGEDVEPLISFVEKMKALNNEVYIAIPITVAYEAKDLPSWAQAIYRIKTFEILREELAKVELLRRRGVKVVAISPQLMPQTIINIIESKRF